MVGASDNDLHPNYIVYKGKMRLNIGLNIYTLSEYIHIDVWVLAQDWGLTLERQLERLIGAIYLARLMLQF